MHTILHLFHFCIHKELRVSFREKTRIPRALHGDEWSMLVWGLEPPSF
jgi:hypothetical protein